MISKIIKDEVGVISRSRKLKLITLTETLTIGYHEKATSNDSFILHCQKKINQKPKTNKHTYMNVTYISLNTKWKLNSFVFCFIDSLSIFNFRYSLNAVIFFHGSLVGFFSFSTLIYITYSFVFSVFRGRSSRKKLCDRALHRITKYPKVPETPRIKIEISKYINYCNAKLMSKQ